MERERSFSAAAFLLTLLTTILPGCGLRNPSAPTWDIELNLPLIDNNLTLAELAGSVGCAKGDSLPTAGAFRVWGQVRPVEMPRFDAGAVSGRVVYELENALPLSIDTAIIYLGCDSAGLYEFPLVVIGPLMAGPMAGSDTNSCCSPVRCKVTVTLDAAQLAALTADGAAVYAGYSIVTQAGPDPNITPDSSAYVRNVAVATIVKRIN